ncbi:hypothetical protein K458DRAFT_396467 [Lentithecium fluviatile CBS 122367]|uniref:Uncharacterized protein n=1 Tax=Lentithecium fluviatile CBS 122367 TaxID=1168545 RepID=A0A6G1IFM0_9PLEO|nr:hypothetical protein K458DRAFT_396467 [Lentithecium fluviatile CBS 122367]
MSKQEPAKDPNTTHGFKRRCISDSPPPKLSPSQGQEKGSNPSPGSPRSRPGNSSMTAGAEGSTDVELLRRNGTPPGIAKSSIRDNGGPAAMRGSSAHVTAAATVRTPSSRNNSWGIPTGVPPSCSGISATAGATSLNDFRSSSGPRASLRHIPGTLDSSGWPSPSSVRDTIRPPQSNRVLYTGPINDPLANRVKGTVWDMPAFAAERGEIASSPSGQAHPGRAYESQNRSEIISSPGDRAETREAYEPRVRENSRNTPTIRERKSFRNYTSLIPPRFVTRTAATNRYRRRPPPVREPGSLRVPGRRYQNIQGVPAHFSPFIGVPVVRHPVDDVDSGYGPPPRIVQEADRRKRGINSWNLPQAALTHRLQNARGIVRPAHMVHYNALWSQAPPDFVDVRLLGDVEVTAAELMTFFPAHHDWHDFYHRLWENGWERGHISGYINWARSRLAPDILLANSLSTYVTHMHTEFHTAYNGNAPRCLGDARNHQPVTDFTLKNWAPSPEMLRPDRDRMIDYPVIELVRGVPLSRLPTGEGRRLLTRVVEEVVRTNDHDLMLSQVSGYAAANGVDLGLTPMPPDADQRAYAELKERIKAHRAILGADARGKGWAFN